MPSENDTNCTQTINKDAKNDLVSVPRKNKSKKLQKKHKTRISRVIAEIIDNPHFPKKRIENAYPKLTDVEVDEKYHYFAKKWTEIRHNKKFNKKSVLPEFAKGLSLDDFAALTADFLGTKGVNRDVVNRVLHTGDDSVQVRSRKVNETTIKTISYFTENYTFDELLDMAAEAIADSKKNDTEKNSYEISKKDFDGLKLPNIIDQYIKKYGYKHLLAEIMKISGYEDETKAKALVFDLVIGSQPPIAIIVVLSQMLQISAEEMIDVVKRSFMVC